MAPEVKKLHKKRQAAKIKYWIIAAILFAILVGIVVLIDHFKARAFVGLIVGYIYSWVLRFMWRWYQIL